MGAAVPTPDPDRESLKARARALVPVLRGRAAEAASLRRLPDATVADFQEAGFFRMLQPRRFGGLEVAPRTFFEVQSIVATGCPSSAWVLGVVAVHSWQLALFADQAQQDVWGDDRSVLISSSYAPTGKVEAVDGGYRISGRWSFSSGCDHCGWVFLGGFAPTGMHTFLLPRADYRIDDTWHVAGLKATGSKDIVVDGAFVPAHRTHELMDGFRCESPGNAVNTSPLYRIPFGQIFVRSVSTTAIGIAAAAHASFVDIGRSRVAASTGKAVKGDPNAQAVSAEAAAIIDEVRTTLHRDADTMMEHAERGEAMPMVLRTQLRFDSARAVSRSIEAVDLLFAASGGRAIFLDSPMQQWFQDAHAAQAHYANRTDNPARNYGGLMLGLDTKDWFI